jgi:hypothetical protein
MTFILFVRLYDLLRDFDEYGSALSYHKFMNQDDVTIVNFSDLDTEDSKEEEGLAEEEKTDPESVDEERTSAPNPEVINAHSVLEFAQQSGLYADDTEEHQGTVGAAQEVDKANEERLPTD